MMTPSNSVGYGICGHKNRYSAKVKDGNWVEDKIAVERLSKYVRPSTTYVSEYTSRFADKSNAIGDVSSSLLEVQHLKAKNKEGLPYKLIFQHGDDANPEVSSYILTSLIFIKGNIPKHTSEIFKCRTIQDSERHFAFQEGRGASQRDRRHSHYDNYHKAII